LRQKGTANTNLTYSCHNDKENFMRIRGEPLIVGVCILVASGSWAYGFAAALFLWTIMDIGDDIIAAIQHREE
jgi:hypothetical protein